MFGRIELEIRKVDVEKIQQLKNVLQLSPTQFLLFVIESLELNSLIIERYEYLEGFKHSSGSNI